MPGLRVLVSTDDPDVLGMFGELTARRHDLVIAAEGDDDLLVAVDRDKPDLVILDLDGRPRGGLRLLNDLAQLRCPATIVLTGSCNPRTLGAARRVGLQRGLIMGLPLPKPFDERLVVGTVLDFMRADDLTIRPRDIEEAMEKDQFELHYQPLVDLRTQRLWGAEALLRWHHPEFGLLMPDLVIPVAERHGLIGPLTRWVARRAMTRQALWDHGEAGFRMTVNVSAQVLRNPDFADEIAGMAAESGINPSHLVLEITESQTLTEEIEVLDTLTRLRLEEIELAVDDFGTGYSSLGRLHRMPFSELKIDKSFVMEASSDPEAEAIVHAIADLGRNLGMTVIAEGVATREAWELVERHDCDIAQGFFISRALSAEDFDVWQSRWFSTSPTGGQELQEGQTAPAEGAETPARLVNGTEAPFDATSGVGHAPNPVPTSRRESAVVKVERNGSTPIFGPPDDAA